MSDTPWTKGPWTPGKYGELRGSNGKGIVVKGLNIGMALAGSGSSEEIANGVLIRFSPQLAELLERMLTDAAGSPDHMTACERTMGATHPCTCGADQARALLAKIKGEMK